MDKNVVNEYTPDYVTPPGESLLDALEALGMSQIELATRIGRTPKAINEIVKGKQAITPEMSILLERALGIPASFWNNRQKRFHEFQARQKEQDRLKTGLSWLKNFNYKLMMENNWVPDTKNRMERLGNLLDFFGVATPQAWSNYWNSLKPGLCLRKPATYSTDDYALAAWLRRGELIGRSIDCRPYEERKFKNSLKDIKRLTLEPASVFPEKLKLICAECGVAVAFVQELPKTASGATRWLTPDKALIQLSLRYKTDDHLWFTFFHEAGHILLHHKKAIFVETDGDASQEEVEANRFATDTLISKEDWLLFPASGNITCNSIIDFAMKIQIAPGIVVGQLQKQRRIRWSDCYNLKRKLRWR